MHDPFSPSTDGADDSRSRPVSYVPSLRHFASAGDDTLRHQPSDLSEHHPLDHTNQTVVELDHFAPAVPPDTMKFKHTDHDATPLEEDPEFDDALSQLTLTGGLPDGPFDFGRFLRKLMKRIDKSDRIHTRELGVYFKDLAVTGLGAAVSYQPTVASFFSASAWLDALRAWRHPATRSLLDRFDGVVRPGEMLLVLGRPGAGCSTLLKTLANQTAEFHAVAGTRAYSHLSPAELAASYRGDVQYCPEDDVHFPTLSVEQTLLFAAKTRAPRSRFDGHSRVQYERIMVDVLLTIFGLRHVRHTKVGDAWVRGVSGGQKKRVSLGEALATRSLVNCWDNSTRGLDASTALEFVQALRVATDAVHMTTIVSIYQAGESLYELFDKVCVIYDGQMAYFGPANRARQYFVDMGYEPANRQTTADFLVAVTDPNGRIPRAPAPPTHPVPRTPSEFAAHFRAHPLAAANAADMQAFRTQPGTEAQAAAYRRSVALEHARHTRGKSAFIISVPMQARALMVRRWQILVGSKETVLLDMGSFVIQAVIMGTIFLRLATTTTTFYSRGGVLFFAILFSALTTMAEIPALFGQRPVVLRQFKAAMYHPWVEALALTLVDVPITVVTLALFCAILYWLVGLQASAAQFFIFFLFVFAMTITMKAWFRALTAAFRSAAPAQTVAGMSILALTLYTGYTIPQPSMVGALKWITYINPLKYGFEALVVNEMHTIAAQCASLVPRGPGYDGTYGLANQVCTTVGSVPGEGAVSGSRYVLLAYGYVYGHLWRNFGIVCAFGMAFVGAYWVLTEFNTRLDGQGTVTWFKRGSESAAVVGRTGRAEHADEEAGKMGVAGVGAGEKGGDEHEREHERDDKRDRDEASDDTHDGGGDKPDQDDEASRSDDTHAHTYPPAHTHRQHTDTEKPTATAPAMTDVFSWQHLSYTVPLADGAARQLLDDVSGFVAPGKLTALMGESGAGKTTLLNVLAARTSVGVVRGERYVSGQALPGDFQAQTGYCQQMDTHQAASTVREALLFSAKMRQPPGVPLAEKAAYVERCLEMCGLSAYADAVVGTLNVEFRKRTTIAVELVAKPRLLLFLDEPTSGLDSQSAWAIVAFLRELADKAGQAILCTIHQPSGELFQVFDRLLLLKVGGQTVYFGDLGWNSETLIGYFERNGARACQPEENPAEYILQVIGAGATATADRDWHELWQASPEAAALQTEIERIHAEGRGRPPVQTTRATKRMFATAWPYQVATLLQRDMQAHWRDPTYIMAKLALNVVAGLFIGFTFWQAKDSMQGTQNKLFSIFMATIISVPLAQQLQVPYIAMRDLYEVRERPSRMYSWTALVTAQILAEVPWNVLGSSVFFLCWYWTVGYASAAMRVGYVYLALGVLFPLYYTTVGQAIASMAPNAQIAALLFSFLFSFVLVFNGVLQPFSQLGWWQWMYHVSPYSYLIEGLLGAAIGNEDINCAPVEFVSLTPPHGLNCSAYLDPFIARAGGYLVDGGATAQCAYCPYRTTNEFLQSSFSIEYAHRWRDVGVFLAFIGFNVVATYVLTYLFRIRSGSVLGAVKARFGARK